MERLHALERLRRTASIPRQLEDGAHRFEPPSAAEGGAARERLAFPLGKELPRPFERPAERCLLRARAARSDAHGERAAAELIAKLSEPEHTEPCGAELDRERNAVERVD